MADHSVMDRPKVSDCSHAVVRPLLLYLSAIMAGLLMQFFAPFGFSLAGGALLGWLAVALGLAIFLAAMREFSRAGTNVPTTLPSTAIVSTGVYKLSRNPIYLGMTLSYVGLALLFENTYMLGLLVPVLIVMRYGVIGREEAYLEGKFGEDYLSYKRRVRRWI